MQAFVMQAEMDRLAAKEQHQAAALQAPTYTTPPSLLPAHSPAYSLTLSP